MHALTQNTPLPVHTEYHWSEEPGLDIAGKIGTGGCSEGYALEKSFPRIAGFGCRNSKLAEVC